MPYDRIPWTGSPPEKMVISLDVGNSFSSVAIAHIQFGRSPIIRTVTRYPGHTSSRTPSAIAYDLKEHPKAFGAETLLPEIFERGRLLGWTVVSGFKAQMLPPTEKKEKRDKEKKLSKKPIKASASTSALSAPPSLKSASMLSLPLLTRTVTAEPEHLIEASSSSGEDRGSREWQPPWLADSPGKELAYQGPLLKVIYCDHLKFLLACARAWFGETSPDGEDIFVRLWSDCTFILTHPADWGPDETDVLREAMQLAQLLPSSFVPGRLVFVKEPAATVYFARKHVKIPDSQWLAPGTSFALCDAADFGTSIIGYTVISLVPLLKLRAYEPVSRLLVGGSSITDAFSVLLSKRLSKSKFRAPEFHQRAMDQFDARIKTKFAGGNEDFRLKLADEGNDSGAKVKDGWVVFKGSEIEEVFKPCIAAITVRLSSIIPRAAAKSILLAGGFGESPYLQRRLREVFEPQQITVIIPDIPTHNAVSEGAVRFYVAETVSPRPLQFALGTSSAVDWSSNWEKGSERTLFESITGQRLVLGRWSEIVPAGTLFEPSTPRSKAFHIKYAILRGPPILNIELWSLLKPSANDRWVTDLKQNPNPNFEQITTLVADLTSLVSLLPIQGVPPAVGAQRSEFTAAERLEKAWVQIEVQVLVYLGTKSLEACVSWMENGTEVRSPATEIPDRFF